MDLKKIRLYRITHRDNLAHILRFGICSKFHADANPDFIQIGSSEIITVRTDHEVGLEGYGRIGDYVPFYFAPQSMMLLNIITGYHIKQTMPENIIFLVVRVEAILKSDIQFFFSDGQANTRFSKHYNDVQDLEKIDWAVVNSGDFAKRSDDTDRTRRYQAEFLIHEKVPIELLAGIVVYNQSRLHL